MKTFRKFLRYWIGIASVLSFLGGWAILAHSPKPVQTQTVSVAATAVPTLPPIQAYGSSTSTNGIPFFSNQTPSTNTQSNQAMPMLTTRGS